MRTMRREDHMNVPECEIARLRKALAKVQWEVDQICPGMDIGDREYNLSHLPEFIQEIMAELDLDHDEEQEPGPPCTRCEERIT